MAGRFVSTPVSDPGGDDERPHRLLMRVDFRADVDLAELAYKKNSTVLAISLFCGSDNPDLSIGPPTVYLQGQPLLQGKWGQATLVGGIFESRVAGVPLLF